MKTKFLTLLFAILFANVTASAQLIAGDTAIGQVISNPNVTLSTNIIYQTKYAFIDLDCDSVADMRIELFKVSTATDGTNTANLFVLNSSFEVCADTVYYDGKRGVKYYNLGDTLNCLGTNDWLYDTIFKLGEYGYWAIQGPTSVTNSFIAYRNTSTSQFGWIKISFELNDQDIGSTPITLSIPEILSPCTTTELSIIDATELTCGIFTFNAIITPPTCNGDCDGSIQITNISGGTPPYIYMWNTAPVQVTPNPTGLCSGNYILIITDNLGNTCDIDLNVPAPLPITFSLEVTANVSCYGFSDGSICVDSLYGGSSPYIFQWNDPLLQTTQCMTNASAGTHTLCVTDGNGCVTCDTATVLEPAEIQVTENVTNPSCPTCCDGEIVLLPIGGNPPYNYVFTPSGSSINLCPGIYDWCVTDAMGCFTCDTVVVSFPTSINNIDNSSVFSIYPNPFKDKIYLNIAKQFVEIYTVLGEKISAHSGTDGIQDYTNEIDLTTIKSGIYFIVIKDSDGKTVYKEKIVKK